MITNDDMQERIVRFNKLKKLGIPLMFIDSALPGHHRMNYAVIGDTASENPEFQPAVAAPHKFQIGMGYAAPGNGPAFHTHDYVEMFLVLKGKWRFYWGNTPDAVDGEVTLGKWDQITIPPRLYRGFECVGKRVGWFYAVLDPHPVFKTKDPVWAPQVEQAAAKLGFTSDGNGRMVKPENYSALRRELAAQLKKLEPQADARAV